MLICNFLVAYDLIEMSELLGIGKRSEMIHTLKKNSKLTQTNVQ